MTRDRHARNGALGPYRVRVVARLLCYSIIIKEHIGTLEIYVFLVTAYACRRWSVVRSMFFKIFLTL